MKILPKTILGFLGFGLVVGLILGGWFFLKPRIDQGEENGQCGIENCHGLEISCGPNIPEYCTEIYEAGDRCRQYAECRVTEETCRFFETPKFSLCKACVENCLSRFENDAELLFGCESQCL